MNAKNAKKTSEKSDSIFPKDVKYLLFNFLDLNKAFDDDVILIFFANNPKKLNRVSCPKYGHPTLISEF